MSVAIAPRVRLPRCRECFGPFSTILAVCTIQSNLHAHPCVKEYRKFIREEQAAREYYTLRSQAVQLFFAKFTKLIDFLRSSIKETALLLPFFFIHSLNKEA